jgi:hypothetical protein
MRKGVIFLSWWLSFAVVIFLSGGIMGQTTYTLTGTGVANGWNRNQFPIMFGNDCSRATQLFTKAKLNGGGIPSTGTVDFAKIAWHPDLSRNILGTVTIYMRHRASAAGAITNASWDLTNAVIVFSGSVNHVLAQGVWWELTFSQNFTWNNVDDIQILVEYQRANSVNQSAGNVWRGYDGNEPANVTAFQSASWPSSCPTTLNATFSPNRKFYDTRLTTAGSSPFAVGTITATQQTGTVIKGSVKQGILKIDIPTSGSVGTLTLNAVTVTTANTNNADISAGGVKLWVGSTLATAVQLGSGQSAASTVTFSGLSQSVTGTTTLWVTYDIASGATLGNFVDAQIATGDITITASGGATAPGTLPGSALNPAGNRKIDYCGSLYTVGCGNYGIQSVSIGTSGVVLNHTATGCTGGLNFADFTGLTINMTSGSTYPFSITNTNGLSFSTGGLGIWIDFNQNGSYGDANEFVGSASGQPYNGSTSDIPYTGNLVLPAVASGSYRMRIKLTENVTQTLGSSCTPDNSGETHDYLVTIAGGSVCSAPSTQASSFTAGSITASSASVNWTNGNGAGRVVYLNSTNSFSDPATGANPTANTAWQNGGQQCIFNGTGSGPVAVSGLSAGTTYYLAVYEYCSPDRVYNTAEGTGSFTTTASPSIALSTHAPQVGAANVAPGTTGVVLHRSALAVTVAQASLTGLTCTTTGTYQTADLTNLKVRYSTDGTLDAGDATLSTYTSVPTAGGLTFPSFSPQAINAGSTGYIFITADIASGATSGRTISINALTTSDFTFASGTKSGSTTAGGLQTITSPPALSLTKTSLTGFTYSVLCGGPSPAQSYSLSGTNLTGAPGNITVTPPSGFEVSTSAGSGYANSLTVPFSSGTLASTTLYVRLKTGQTAGSYTGNLTHSGGGANQNLSLTGLVTSNGPTPAIIGSGTTTTAVPFQNFGGANRCNRTATIYTKAILNQATGWTSGSGSQVITKLAWQAATNGNLSGNVKIYMGHTSATSSSTADDWSTQILTNTFLVYDGPLSFALSTSNYNEIQLQTPFIWDNTNNLKVAIEFTSGVNTTSSWYATSGGNTIESANFSSSCPATLSNGSNSRYLNLSINTAGPTPTITPSVASLTGFNYIIGAGPSTSQSYTLTGTNLICGPITISAPTHFEISTDNSTFLNSIQLSVSGSALTGQPITIYVRLKAGVTAGTYTNEQISHTVPGGSTLQVSCSGFVTDSWTGAVSTDWNTAGNWASGSVPATGASTYIPTSGVVNFPLINGGISLQDLEIFPSASLTITSGNSLTISGTLTNNGSITVENNAALVQGSGSSLAGSGTFNVRRATPAGSGNLMRFMGSPISNVAVSSFGITASGADGGQIISFPNCSTTAIDANSPYGPIMYLDQSAVSTNNCAQEFWFVKSSGTLSNGRGYSMLTAPSTSYQFSGTINNGNISQNSLGYSALGNVDIPGGLSQTTRGWHLLSNPYPSPIFINNSNRPSGFDAQIQLWDAANNTWVPVNTSVSTANIGVGQAFQVRVTTPGSSANFVFTNAMRTTGAPTFYANPYSSLPHVELILANGNDQHTHYVYFHPNGTDLFDPLLDVSLLQSNAAGTYLYSLAQNTTGYLEEVTHSSLSNGYFTTLSSTIPIHVQTPFQGQGVLTLQGMGSLPTNTQVFLKDELTGLESMVQDGQSINVNFQGPVKGHRFTLKLVNQGLANSEELLLEQIIAFADPNHKLHLHFPKMVDFPVNIQLMDVQGRQLASYQVAEQVEKAQINLPTSLSHGLYMIFIQTASGHKVTKRFTISH